MLSNYVGIDPADKCKWYDRKQKKKADKDQLVAVAIYNKFMGRIDKADMLLSLYRSNIWSKKRYQQLAFHMFILLLKKNWVWYKEIGGNYLLVKFTVSVAKSLIYGIAQSFSDETDDNHQPRVRYLKRPQVTTDIRYNKNYHCPVHLDLPHAQCCKNIVFVKHDINIYLCILPLKWDLTKHCFKDFHGVWMFCNKHYAQ